MTPERNLTRRRSSIPPIFLPLIPTYRGGDSLICSVKSVLHSLQGKNMATPSTRPRMVFCMCVHAKRVRRMRGRRLPRPVFPSPPALRPSFFQDVLLDSSLPPSLPAPLLPPCSNLNTYLLQRRRFVRILDRHVVQKAPRASPQRVFVQRAIGVAPFLQLGGLQDFVLVFVRDFTLERHAE